MQNIFSGTSADKRTFGHSSPVFILFSAAEFFPSTSIYMIHNQNILRNLALERLIALWELGSDINYETLFRCKQRPLLGCWSLLLQPWEKTSWTKQPSYITTKLHTQFILRRASSSVCDSQGRRSLTRCWLLGPSCSFFWSPWIGSRLRFRVGGVFSFCAAGHKGTDPPWWLLWPGWRSSPHNKYCNISDPVYELSFWNSFRILLEPVVLFCTC